MAIPTYDRFIEPILRFLSHHPDGAATGDVYEAAARACGLTAEDRKAILPSGKQEVYRNRIGWAHDRLKRAGCSQSVRRGWWQLTEAGRKLALQYPNGLPEAEVARIADHDGEPGAAVVTQPVAANEPRTVSPRERIDLAASELRESAARELLEFLVQGPPLLFERVVLELLYKMGYGQSREALLHTGRTGDGGIDGVVSLDRLGLENVYVQAKRWAPGNTVRAPQIRDLIGALSTHGATKGVLMTTSTFTEEARRTAAGARTAHIALVDGERLAELLIEHEIGVSHEIVKIPKIDTDYFEDL